MTDAPVIPLEVLLGNPEKAHPQISPGGDRTAYLAPVDGVLNVWVGTTGGDDPELGRGERREARPGGSLLG